MICSTGRHQLLPDDPPDVRAQQAAECASMCAPTPTTDTDAPGQQPEHHTSRESAPGTKKEESIAPPARTPDLFRGLLGEIVNAAEPTTEADPVGVLVSLLAGAGVLAGHGPHVQVGNTRHPLLIWPLLFGRTGSGRKGEATETARLFLLSSCQELPELAVTGMSSGEGLIERIRDVANEDDAGGTEDKRLLVTEPEFASVMARSKREGSTLASVLRQAWDGRALSVLNRTALRASGSHVGIVGHITPREFRLRLAEAEMAGGTYNRFLPVYVERPHRLAMPPGVDEECVASLGKRLAEALDAARTHTRLQLDSSAAALWCNELYDEFTGVDDEEAAWTEFTQRAAPYCLRIGGLYAALDDRALINRDDLAAAAVLVRYSIKSARYVLDRQTRDPRLDRIRRALDGAGTEGLNRTDISGLFSRNVSKTVLAELLDALIAGGDYEAVEVKTGGRPAQRYRRTETRGTADA